MTHTQQLVVLAAALTLAGACRGPGSDPAPVRSEPATEPAKQVAPEQPAAPAVPEQPAAPPASEQPAPAPPTLTAPVAASPDVDEAADPDPYLMLSTGPSFEGGTGEDCSFELESMPKSWVFSNWLELYDWMARDAGVDDGQRPKDDAEAKTWLRVKDGGSLVLAVIWAHAFYTSYAGVLERDDGLLQLWKLGEPEADDSCPLGPEDSEYEPALGYMPGLESVSVVFEDSVGEWPDEDDELAGRHSCSSANRTHVDLIVEPNSNISAMLTRVSESAKHDVDDVMQLRLEDDGLYVDGCGLRNKRLIRTVPSRPGYPD